MKIEDAGLYKAFTTVVSNQVYQILFKVEVLSDSTAGFFYTEFVASSVVAIAIGMFAVCYTVVHYLDYLGKKRHGESQSKV